MQEYFDRKSRAPSPSLSKANKMWYSAPPNLEDHNKDIVKIFLGKFRMHLPQTLSIFKESTVGLTNRVEYTLAMAATGGLFCTVPGSAEVAKSMYNDARRILLASVCTYVTPCMPSTDSFAVQCQKYTRRSSGDSRRETRNGEDGKDANFSHSTTANTL